MIKVFFFFEGSHAFSISIFKHNLFVLSEFWRFTRRRNQHFSLKLVVLLAGNRPIS